MLSPLPKQNFSEFVVIFLAVVAADILAEYLMAYVLKLKPRQ